MRTRIFKDESDRRLTDNEFKAWINRVLNKRKNFNNK
jgi:hypothetical protein